MREVYLDNSATTKPCPEAVAAMTRLLTEDYGNPSSVHALGLAAERAVKTARAQAAAALGASPAELVFTGSGTEADNLAIFGTVLPALNRGGRVITTDAEHPAVLRPMQRLEELGFEVVYLSTRGGAPDMDALREALTPKTLLVSLMHVNNETGAIFPVREARRVLDAAKSRALLHCDAVQSFLKLPFTARSLGADLLSLSAHKIHGPKGCGALYVRKGVHLHAHTLGGGQEQGLRSGTENTPAIAGFGAACAALAADGTRYETLEALCACALERLRTVPGLVITRPAQAAPHILSLSLPPVPSEVILRVLESRGVYVSAGSACSSHRKGSPVLAAYGLARELRDSAFRVSLSHMNTREDIDALAEALAACPGALGMKPRKER